MISLVLLVAAGLLAVTAWVRLAPLDTAQWHRMPGAVEVGGQSNGAMRIIDAEEGHWPALNDAIKATPRTSVLAGLPQDGMITYVTRSAVFGFPDVTTIRLRDGKIDIVGRARYGLSDFGVNAARIDGWIDTVTQ